MSAFTLYAAEGESTAFMLKAERVDTMTVYVERVQNDGSDGLPVSGDALATVKRGSDAQRKRRRQIAAAIRMEAQR